MKTITALITGGQTLARHTRNLILDPNPRLWGKAKDINEDISNRLRKIASMRAVLPVYFP